MALDDDYIEVRMLCNGRTSYKNLIKCNDHDKIIKMFRFLQDKYGIVLKGNKGWFE